MAVQKKQSVVPASQGPLSTRIIESQKRGNGSNKKPGEKGNSIKPISQAKKTVSSATVNKSPPISNAASPRLTSGHNGANVDERLKLARERREEHQKLLASRELSRLEREQRARRYYEQHLQERKKTIQEQRLKEERRHTAVEEKRNQRLKEEKERNESTVRKTIEKSHKTIEKTQKAQQNLGHNSRGRKLTKPNVPRGLPLTTWEKNLVSRLLAPTCSYLARSKSAGCQPGDEVVHVCRRSVSYQSMNSTTSPPKPQHHAGPVQRGSPASPRPVQYGSPGCPRPVQYGSPACPRPVQYGSPGCPRPVQRGSPACPRPVQYGSPACPRPVQYGSSACPRPVRVGSSASPRPSSSHNRSIGLSQIKPGQVQNVDKKIPSPRSDSSSPALNTTNVKPATNAPSRTPSPPEQTRRRAIRRHAAPLQLELPPVPEEDLPVCSSPLAPGNLRPIRTLAEGQHEETEEENPPETLCSNSPDTQAVATTRTDGDESSSQMHPVLPTAPQPPEVTSRPSAGTADPEEAARLLAEKRREARLQREREEAERRSGEELERRRGEERARQQAETRRLVEEKRRREEEQQRQADEERAQAMREAALLQKLREEEQAKESKRVEQIKQEIEIRLQREEAERQSRKKRLEEIMRRTRRADCADMKSGPVRILSNENTEPMQNDTPEGAVKLPVGTKQSQLGLNGVEDMVPVVAFKERRSLRNLTGLDEIQTHQRAEVI